MSITSRFRIEVLLGSIETVGAFDLDAELMIWVDWQRRADSVAIQQEAEHLRGSVSPRKLRPAVAHGGASPVHRADVRRDRSRGTRQSPRPQQPVPTNAPV